MTGSLKDQTVLVIGRGSGLARAIALAAQDAGSQVIAAGRSAGALAAGTVDHVVSTASARARGHKGGRPYKMTPAKLRLAAASMGQPDTKISELCTELGITRQTLYRHVSPTGQLRPDGLKLLADRQRRPR